MRDVGTVIVDRLNVRRIPGDQDADIIGALSRGDTFDILQRRQGIKAYWLRTVAGWVAEYNKASNERFVSIKSVPDPLPDDPVFPPPHPEPPPLLPDRPDYKGWAVCVAIIAALGGLVYACGGPVN